jgi:hypothetical protein
MTFNSYVVDIGLFAVIGTFRLIRGDVSSLGGISPWAVYFRSIRLIRCSLIFRVIFFYKHLKMLRLF